MALVIPDISEVVLLNNMLNIATPTNTVLHLYSNNLTPSSTTVIGDVTEVASGGYASVTLTSSSWTVATSVGGITTATYSEQTFNITTSSTIYGYYITNVAGDLLWLERFTAAPFQLPGSGGQILVTSTISLNSCS
jgi:hypothetical protein